MQSAITVVILTVQSACDRLLTMNDHLMTTNNHSCNLLVKVRKKCEIRP